MTAPRKIIAPLARELAEVAATEVGACIRPLAVRRIDTETGARSTIPIPCGSTKASKCPPCADRARRLRMWQANEGWHLDADPEIVTAEPTAEQLAIIGYRADLEAARAAALAENDTDAVTDLDRAIGDADDMVRAAGARGSTRPPGERKPRRVRSTRRRQDAPNLPRLPVAARTTGRTFETPDGRTYRPSTFLTLTLPSYGRVYSDGSPVDPERYDYRAAARDAIHFGDLIDRFWQNLRRAVGWNVQYFAAVEPQRRGAPHLHAAVRGTIPRKLLRQVAAATYHQVWWPAHDEPVYSPDRLPVWDETLDQPGYVDPDTGRPLRCWNAALDQLADDPTAPPAHVVRFGPQVDIQGVLGDTEQAGHCLRYLVKYLTKSLGECHEPDSSSAIAHVDRLADALRYEPCSPTCANWLLYGVAPDNAKAGLVPGLCRGKAHKRENLGYGGRRCLVSRKWSGRNLTEHRTERRDHVLRTLGVVGAAVEQSTPDGERERYQWQPIRPSDPDQPDRLELMFRLISERKRWRQQYERARDRAAQLPATDTDAA